MKLWKKILIGVGILALLALGALGYGIMKVNDVYTEQIKPDMEKYVQMSKEEQDEYILSHMEKLLKADQNRDDEMAKQELAAMQNDAAVRQAGLEFGRSLCASFISLSDDITDKLTPEDKAKFKQEEEAFEVRLQNYNEALSKYTEKTKAAE